MLAQQQPTQQPKSQKQNSKGIELRETGARAATRIQRSQSEPSKDSQRHKATMDAAASSAPTTPYHNLSLAQAVVTFSVDTILVWLSTAITSSSSSERRSEASPAAPPSPPPLPEKTVVDMDVVLGVMGAAGPASVGFEEAAALFEGEEATVEEAWAAFAVFDRDGDGFVDAGELGSVLRALGFGSGDAECRRMIDAYDEDKDGRIDFREFLNLMERTHQ